MERTKAEEAFIDQRTRQLLVKWADYCIRNNGGLPDIRSMPVPSREEIEAWVRSTPHAPSGAIHPALREIRDLIGKLELHPEYVEFALAKGWLGKTVKDGCRHLTAAGWNTAASFLKR